jgi:hypothetical protein
MKLVPFCDETDRILLLAEVIWPSKRLRELEREAVRAERKDGERSSVVD